MVAPLIRADFNTGECIGIVLTDGINSIDLVSLFLVTKFEASSVDEVITRRPISRTGGFSEITKPITYGWKGVFEIARRDGALTNLYLKSQDFSILNFKNLTMGVVIVNQPEVYADDFFSYVILEQQALDKYIFTDVALSGHNFGAFIGVSAVKQSINFNASSLQTN